MAKLIERPLLRLTEPSASPTGTPAETRTDERDCTTHNVAKFPLSKSEKLLIEIIRDLLELPQSQPVTPDDDFFDLGGDSLLATLPDIPGQSTLRHFHGCERPF